MARIWTEAYRSGKHAAPWEYWGSVDDHLRAPSLIPKNVLLVSVASFTFQFFTEQQLRDCLEYFSRKTHPSSRVAIGGADHWEAQRWFERLPMYLLEAPKRLKVISALSEALRLIEQGEFPVLSHPGILGKSTSVDWGLCPQTPGIYRLPPEWLVSLGRIAPPRHSGP